MSKRIIAVFLSVIIAFSFSVSVFAAGNDGAETVSVVNYSQLDESDFDAPVIFIRGFGLGIYSGLSTETEDDDKSITSVSGDVLLDSVKKYGVSLVGSLIAKNYDVFTQTAINFIDPIFGALACDENGVPDPDTGIKSKSDIYHNGAYGYENAYEFNYDWRLDMHTVAAELDEYIDYVMKLTDSEQVVLAAFSLGNCVLMTYLYEYYYTAADYAEKDHIRAVMIMSSATNGAEMCADPFAGNISVDSTSLMRYLSETMADSDSSGSIFTLLEILYSFGALDPIADFADRLIQTICDNALNEIAFDSFATIPGLYAMMSQEQYKASEAYIFDTAEKQAKYAGLLEKNRYYHDCVQVNIDNIIDSLLDDGINTAIIAQYGASCLPLSADNDKMSDSIISTAAESFGATCAEVDGTLGENYVQAVECECGKNHVSADNQIDASTCAYPDITWFAKGLRHTESSDYLAVLVNTIAYSDEQITVWDNADIPQFLVAQDGQRLVPLTQENAEPVSAYEDSVSNIFLTVKNIFA